uniref:Uncharacterized protein n=1 Tax=Spironucleus salmonicida TaxID=348837 RepID=V6LW40_9EUKA|eukprot:EST47926.1 Hypothetical protein SS50377_11967 [Spironucleus salmonicida]
MGSAKCYLANENASFYSTHFPQRPAPSARRVCYLAFHGDGDYILLAVRRSHNNSFFGQTESSKYLPNRQQNVPTEKLQVCPDILIRGTQNGTGCKRMITQELAFIIDSHSAVLAAWPFQAESHLRVQLNIAGSQVLGQKLSQPALLVLFLDTIEHQVRGWKLSQFAFFRICCSSRVSSTRIRANSQANPGSRKAIQTGLTTFMRACEPGPVAPNLLQKKGDPLRACSGALLELQATLPHLHCVAHLKSVCCRLFVGPGQRSSCCQTMYAIYGARKMTTKYAYNGIIAQAENGPHPSA